jgi:DNA polymerase I-like protein with 3'-5' exonuclease and polymerase domains
MNTLTLDVETTTTNMGHPFDKNNKLISVGIKKNDGPTVTYDIEYSVDPYQELLNDIQIAVNEADVLVGFNIKFDLHWLQRYGIDFKTKRVWDCQLVQFIIMNQSNPYPSLNGTAEYYDLGTKLDEVKENYWKNGIDTDKIPYDILDEYLKQDVELTYSVFIEQHDMIQGKERLISLHNQDLLVLQDMEYNGLQYEYDRSLILGNELDEQISKLNKKLHDYHTYDSFNPNSGEHLSAFLYGGNIKERFQQPIGHYKTGTRTGEVKYKWEERLVEFPRRFEPLEGSELKKEGFYSTNDDTLKRLQGSEESMKILNILLTRATLEKRRSTYYIGVPALVDTMGWTNNLIHGQLNQCVAKTGRLSSSKPNLQNFDGEIKSLFTTRYGD